MILLALLGFVQLPPIQPFTDSLRAAVRTGDEAAVKGMFLSPGDSGYLFQMAKNRGGLGSLNVSVIPSPPGWKASGEYWAVLHTRQDIEEDHDPVYPVVVSDERWKLGPEIPEDSTLGAKITHAAMDVRLSPSDHRVAIHTRLNLALGRLNKAPLFRLNDSFQVDRALEVGDEVASPKEGEWVHAGSLLIPWTIKVPATLSFDYSGTLTTRNEDKLDEHACYLTAWWVPTLGRSPFTTSTRVVGPSGWVLQSEGKPIPAEDFDFKGVPAGAGEQVACWRCDVPISYPKVIAGQFKLAAERRERGKVYRDYQLGTPDAAKGKIIVDKIAAAISWYEEHLAPWPFDEYSCYEADSYYGIESYNYTLLNARIADWAVGHEAGHTYFGGLVPCAYVHDSWNESMTQYVDSVLRQNDADQTLESAYASLRLAVPLTQMPVAHEYGSATYYRGAFVLRMLEHQIGTPAMYSGIKALIADRRGKDTTWYDLRGYFEKVSGQKLDWFWRQWVSGARFPTLSITDAQGVPTSSGTKVFVTVRQTGTAASYRFKLKVIARGIEKEVSDEFEMNSPEATFELNLGKGVRAYEAEVDTLGYVLCPRLKPVKVKL